MNGVQMIQMGQMSIRLEAIALRLKAIAIIDSLSSMGRKIWTVALSLSLAPSCRPSWNPAQAPSWMRGH